MAQQLLELAHEDLKCRLSLRDQMELNRPHRRKPTWRGYNPVDHGDLADQDFPEMRHICQAVLVSVLLELQQVLLHIRDNKAESQDSARRLRSLVTADASHQILQIVAAIDTSSPLSLRVTVATSNRKAIPPQAGPRRPNIGDQIHWQLGMFHRTSEAYSHLKLTLTQHLVVPKLLCNGSRSIGDDLSRSMLRAEQFEASERR